MHDTEVVGRSEISCLRGVGIAGMERETKGNISGDVDTANRDFETFNTFMSWTITKKDSLF